MLANQDRKVTIIFFVALFKRSCQPRNCRSLYPMASLAFLDQIYGNMPATGKNHFIS